nr:hypothetical protein [Tanacetum cinerariifolium]
MHTGYGVPGGRTLYSGYPDRPSLLPHQNQPPSGTGSGPGYVKQVPPLYSSSGYPAGTGYNSGGYASVVAAAAQEYPRQNSYRTFMNRLPPIQGGYVDSKNYGLSPGYPTQPNMHTFSFDTMGNLFALICYKNMNLHKVDYVKV